MCNEFKDRIAELEAQLAKKDQTIRQIEYQHDQDIQEIQRLRKLIEIKDSITFNKGLSYAERNGLQGIVANHPDQILSGEKFEIDVWKERQAVGIGSDCASKLLSTLNEVGGIEYDVSTTKVDGKPKSQSSIAIRLDAIGTVNTKDATKRVMQREAENTRRKTRMEAANHPICPSCGSSEHIHTLLTPGCMKCGKSFDGSDFEDQRQLVKTELIRWEEEVADEALTEETQDATSANTEQAETFTTTTNTTDEPEWVRAGYQDDCLPPEPDDIREAYEPPVVVRTAPAPAPKRPVSAKVKGWYQEFLKEQGSISLIEDMLIYELPRENKNYQQFIDMHTSELKMLLAQ